MHNLFEVFQMIDLYHSYLIAKGIKFSGDGYPIFENSMFLNEYPDMVVPFNQKKNRRVKNPQKTVICFFGGDKYIYPRYEKIFDELDTYKKYMGVVEPDITLTEDMDIEWQSVTMLLNQLFMAVLAVNGIKVILNTRMGLSDTAIAFENIPKKIMVASGFLGACPYKAPRDFSYVSKILRLYPEKVIIFGPCEVDAQEKLNRMGISFRTYSSFRTLCKEVAL